MKLLDNLSKKLNRTQKMIIGLIVPLILIIIYVVVAEEVGSSYVGTDALVWKENWYFYIILLSVIGYFEYKLFQDVESEKI